MDTPKPDLEHLSDLTRRYAKTSGKGAGLGPLLGGIWILLLGGSNAWLYWRAFRFSGCDCSGRSFLRFLIRSQEQIHNPWFLVLVFIAPFVYLATLKWLQDRVDGHFGLVQPQLTPKQQTRAKAYRVYVTIGELCFVGFWVLYAKADPIVGRSLAGMIAASVMCLGVIWIVWFFDRRQDLMTTEMVFLIPTIILAGLRPDLVLMVSIAYVLFGMILSVRGLIQHLAFRKARKELASLNETQP